MSGSTWLPGGAPSSGSDTFIGGAGGDSPAGAGGGNDSMYGAGGNDSLRGEGGNDTLAGGTGNDTLDGSTGTDFVDYSGAAGSVTANLTNIGTGNASADGDGGQDSLFGMNGIIGSGFADSLSAGTGGGTAQDFFIDGGAGDDRIFTGNGNDTLIGGDGSDTLLAGNGNDVLVGGERSADGTYYVDDGDRDYIGTGSNSDTSYAFANDVVYNSQNSGSEILYIPEGYVNSGNTVSLAFPNTSGGPTNRTFQVWTDGTDSIYAAGFATGQIRATYVCFAEGTLIATARGEVAVQDLQVGDLVVTAHGGAALQPVVWLGHTRANVARHPEKTKAAPILIKAGALADGVPHRDLRVSPDHAMFLDGRLVPAKHLVNGTTIVQELWCPEVTYWHVELPAHGLLVSEGAVSESYFDDGNRKHFDNYGITTLFKDFASERSNGRYAEAACYPLLEGGEALERIRTRLAARAAAVESARDAARRSA